MSPGSEMGNYGNQLIQHVIVINETVKPCRSEWVTERYVTFITLLILLICIYIYRVFKKPFNNSGCGFLHKNKQNCQ